MPKVAGNAHRRDDMKLYPPIAIIASILFLLVCLYGAGDVNFYLSGPVTGVAIGDCYHFNVGVDLSPTVRYYVDEC
jgi:hypothetical protein